MRQCQRRSTIHVEQLQFSLNRVLDELARVAEPRVVDQQSDLDTFQPRREGRQEIVLAQIALNRSNFNTMCSNEIVRGFFETHETAGNQHQVESARGERTAELQADAR